MEDWQKEIIVKNMDTLVKLTICNHQLLAKLLACGILSENDVEELNTFANTRKAFELYTIVQKKSHSFEILLEGLKETNQSGAVDVLTAGLLKRKTLVVDDVGEITYDENDILGKGSYGTTVCKGKLGDSREVAVKRINSDAVEAIRAVDEINVLKACDAHENIVRYFGSKQIPNYILILLELCDMTLKDWINNKSIDIHPVEILRQVTVGLEWLHELKIVHRDLKPENILLTRKLVRVKISDFGLSRRILDDKSFVATSVVSGTQGWIAPEILAQVIQGNDKQCRFTYASDVFALGCVYYFVLSDGKHAFGDCIRSQANILDGKMMIESKELLYICPKNSILIRLMVSKNPASRPTCKTLLNCPIFWSKERRVGFITEMISNQDIFRRTISSFIASESRVCPIDHEAEVNALRAQGYQVEQTVGCVVPILYMQLNDTNGAHDQGTPPQSPACINVDENIYNQYSTKDEVPENEGEQPTATTSFAKLQIEDRNTPINSISKSDSSKAKSEGENENNAIHIHIPLPEGLQKLSTSSNLVPLVPSLEDLKNPYQFVKEGSYYPEGMKQAYLFLKDATLLKNITTANFEIETEEMFEPDNHIQFLQLLTKTKLSVKDRLYYHNPSNLTALHFAAIHGRRNHLMKLTKFLISIGIDLNAVDKYGRTFLHLAPSNLTASLYHELIEYLINEKKITSFASVDKRGWTIFHWALYYITPLDETLRLFMSYDLDFSTVDCNGDSIIFQAIKGGRSESCLKFLLKLGGNWTLSNMYGETVLHIAVLCGNIPALRLFIELGVDVNAQTKYGSTPLHLVFQTNTNMLNEAVDVLLEHGADLNIYDKKGKLPLHLAIESAEIGRTQYYTVNLLRNFPF
ncbi:unnamed protein product [Orchesella dallaii]|uniref:Uncharacterized protein n=1 Tax=Orchesella dallaii TaxID=48710 RepID=A0ABP1S6L2_9HEXA